MNESNLTKSCSVCTQDIPLLAKKCIHCGSYQDFRRYLDVGNTSLALVIAFITILGIVADKLGSVYSSLFSDPHPKVAFHIDQIDDEKIKVLYSNFGEKDVLVSDGVLCRVPVVRLDSGYLKSAEGRSGLDKLKYPSGPEVEFLSMSVYLTSNIDRVVRPNSSLFVEYVIHQRRPEERGSFNSRAEQVFGYCHTKAVDGVGDDFNDFVTLPELDVYFMQKSIRKKLRYGY